MWRNNRGRRLRNGLGDRRRHASGGRRSQDVHAASGTRLLPLEPRTEARNVKDVIARQLLGAAVARHLLAANNAYIVHTSQFFLSSVRVQSVHVANRSSRHNYIV